MKRLKKKLLASLLMVMLVLNHIGILISNAVEDPTYNAEMELTTTTTGYKAGETFTVDLIAKSLDSNGMPLRNFSFDIQYNEAYMKCIKIETVGNYDNVKVDPALGTAIPTGQYINVTQKDNNNPQCFPQGGIMLRFTFEGIKDSTEGTEEERTIKLNNGSLYYEDDTYGAYFDGAENDEPVCNEPSIVVPLKPAGAQPHNIVITKTDASGVAITNNSALFKIIQPEGEALYKPTEADGTIQLNNIPKPSGVGPFVYTITEVLEPTGYVKNEKDATIEVSFAEDGSVLSATATNATASVTASGDTIQISIANEERPPEVETETFNLIINKIDDEGTSITSDTAEFTLTTPNGTKSSHITDVATGKTATISITSPKQAGTYTYFIQETKSPAGYLTENKNVVLELTYQQVGNKIVLVDGKVVSNNNQVITPVDVDGTKTITIDVKNNKEIQTFEYTVSIEKVKNDDVHSAITEDTAMFEISKDGNLIEYVKTNALGTTNFKFKMKENEIVEGQEYIYTIKEVKNPQGYVKDESEKVIKFTFNADGSIASVETTGDNIIKENNTNKVANIKIVNEEITQPVMPTPEDFQLTLKKVNKSGNVITTDTAIFELTLPDGTQTQYTTTNGETTGITITPPTQAGKEIYFLREIKAPSGYEALKDNLVIEINYIEQDGKIVLENAKIKDYEDLVVTPTTVDGTKNLTISVKNEQSVHYYVEIENIEKETKNVIQPGGAIFKITNTKTNEYKYVETEPTTGSIKIPYGIPTTAGTVTYKIEQSKATNGYILNTDEVTVEITFAMQDGVMKIAGSTVTGATKVDASEDTVKLQIENEKEPVMEKENYSIQINKKDRDTGNIITQGSATFTVVLPDGSTKEYSTTDGQALISGLTADEPKDVIFVIRETQAPAGYIQEEQMIVVKLSYTKEEGKIVVTNPVIQVGGDIATINKTDSIVQLDITNEMQPIEINYSINVEKVDEDWNIISDDLAIFEITKLDGTKELKNTVNGIMNITETVSQKELTEDNLVTIKEVKAPTGYKLNEEPVVLELTFEDTNSDGIKELTQTDITQGSAAHTSTSNVDIQIQNTKPTEKSEFTVNITTVKEEPDGTYTTITQPSIFTVVDIQSKNIWGETVAGTFSNNYEMPNLENTYTFTLKQLTKPSGYQLNNTQTELAITFEKDENGQMKITNVQKTIGDAMVDTEIVNNIINVKVKNIEESTTTPEPSEGVFSINIHKTDEEGNTLTEATFKFISPDGTTIERQTTNGLLNLNNLPTPSKVGKGMYIIKETVSPEGYERNEDNIVLEIDFVNKQGNIVASNPRLVLGNATVSIEENTIQVDVVNKKAPVIKKYNLNINAIEPNGSNYLPITTDNAIYEISDVNGKTEYVSTVNGLATIELSIPEEDIGEDKTLEYNIKQVKTPNGYTESGTQKTITIQLDDRYEVDSFEVNGDNITKYTRTKSNGNVSVGIINTRVPIQPTNQAFKMVINKTDELGASIITDTAEFSLVLPDGTKSTYATNITTGKTPAILVTPEGEGTYLYIVKETKAPNGYELENTNHLLKLTFSKVGDNIVLTNAELDDRNVTITERDSTKQIEIKVQNKKVVEPEAKPKEYMVSIRKVETDELNNLVPITSSTAYFKVMKEAEVIGIIETNRLGIANVKISMLENEIVTNQDYVYTIQEIKAPIGYELDETPKTLKIRFNEAKQIASATLNDEVLTVLGNSVTVQIENEKTPEPVEPEEKTFMMTIEKVDGSGNLITSDSANFTITSESGEKVQKTTASTGKIENIRITAPKQEGKYQYFIKETKAPNGYILNYQTITLEINYTKNATGEIVIANEEDVKIVYGEGARAEKTVDGFKVIIENKLDEQSEPELGEFGMILKKTDREWNPIKTSTAIFKLTNNQTGKYVYEQTELGTGAIPVQMQEMPKQPGTFVYTVSEIKAPEGYTPNLDAITVEVTFARDSQGVMKITNVIARTPNANAVRGTYIENMVTIEITNEVEEEVVPPQPSIGELSIKLNKVNAADATLIKNNAAKFTLTLQDGQKMEVETNADGSVQINNIEMPKQEGTYPYFIKEIKAPNGYKLEDTVVVLEVNVQKDETGKLFIAEANIVQGENAIILNTQDTNIELNVLNKTEGSDDNKPTDPDDNKPTNPDDNKPTNPDDNKPTDPDDNKPTNPDDNKPEEKYADIETTKMLTKIVEKNTKTGSTKTTKFESQQEVTKVEIVGEQFANTQLQLTYKIIAKNIGDKEGTIQNIIDMVPEGLKLEPKDNINWIIKDNIAYYDTNNLVLQPGQSKEVEIVLNYNGSSKKAGNITNYAKIVAIGEKPDESDNGNNTDKSVLIISIKTGKEGMVYTCLTFTVLTILTLGVIAIKKYAM